MYLGDRDSYYEDFDTNNLPKGEKAKTGGIHSDNLSTLFKNGAENDYNRETVGQKRPITSNDSGNNTPAKVPSLNQIDQEHQIPQKLGDAISKRLEK